eukprot:TRINITY_DN90220_c0_g1_i1.p1 TRINITY_DN90220_c0_g1~~TRINITY_DN90220_c0_g1_i1.p1  ORF type:complete len:862 (-),score=79.18 TRINITY_DN90220_c0_g1_i1:63-2648(-)
MLAAKAARCISRECGSEILSNVSYSIVSGSRAAQQRGFSGLVGRLQHGGRNSARLVGAGVFGSGCAVAFTLNAQRSSLVFAEERKPDHETSKGKKGESSVVAGSCSSSSKSSRSNVVQCEESGDNGNANSNARSKKKQPTDRSRVITLEELRQNRDETSCWVAYGGDVYDVTEFLKDHPGGCDPLLMAGGQALELFWEKYPIHFDKKATEQLDRLPKIGRLSEQDAARAVDKADPENAGSIAAVALRDNSKAITKANAMQRGHVWDLVYIGCVGPLWGGVKMFLSLIGSLFPSLVDVIARRLPIAVPGFAESRRITAVVEQASSSSAEKGAKEERPARVAVIGGGIAGVGCAYTLANSGFQVTIFEARSVLGGNAQTGTFELDSGGSGKKKVTQDLAVLFWAPEYYKNYMCFLDAIKVKPEILSVPYVLRVRSAIEGSSSSNNTGSSTSGAELRNIFKSEFFTPPGHPLYDLLNDHSLEERFKDDFKRFDRMTLWSKRITDFFCMSSEPTFYKSCQVQARLNPLNYISFRRLTEVFGMTPEFYETILRPFHGIQMTTTKIDDMPAAVWGILNEVVPITSSRKHMSWGAGNSHEVFDKATAGCKVQLNARVLAVRKDKEDKGLLVYTDSDEHGTGFTGKPGEGQKFDRVVFACPAPAAGNILKCGGWYENALLRAVGYHDDYTRDDWREWLEVPVHQDPNVLPADKRDHLMENAAFVVDHDATGDSQGRKYGCTQYTCVLGSWSPAAKAAGFERGTQAPMFMTQCLREDSPLDEGKVLKTFSAPRAHPDLTMKNMAITQMLPLIQGRNGVYYCSNYTVPGNGHDLSLLGGIVVAHAIGAKYPFEDNRGARRDFEYLRTFMGI